MPRVRSLLRNTPFRLAFLFALLFVTSFFVVGSIVYVLLREELKHRQERMILADIRYFTTIYHQGGVSSLINSLDQRARSNAHHESVFGLYDQDGSQLSGNITISPKKMGWITIDAHQLGLNDDTHYLGYATWLDRTQLFVGLSTVETDELIDTALASLGWTTLVVFLLALGGGLYLASLVKRRLKNISDTLNKVAHGDASARLWVSPHDDDIDHLAHQINEALDNLERLMIGMRQMGSDIAHELKTPLNRLCIAVDVARTKATKNQDIQEELDNAWQEASQINETFEALLQITQIEAGRLRERFAPVNLADVITMIAETYEVVCVDKQQTLHTRLSNHEQLIIQGDKRLIAQMLANLVENAIRHCPEGTTMHLSASAADTQVSVVLTDNGPGIPAAERDRVFRRLYRLDRSRSTPGSGLGLALVKAVVECHAAAIQLLDNHPGLRVSISFPRLRPS
jgi:signal transduction histidine kinase